MSSDLVSFCILLVSGSEQNRDMLRRAAAATSVPVDVLEAATGFAACELLAKNEINLVFIDAAIDLADRNALIADAQVARPQPFVLLVAASQGQATILAHARVDGIVIKPATAEDARRLLERTIQERMPNR